MKAHIVLHCLLPQSSAQNVPLKYGFFRILICVTITDRKYGREEHSRRRGKYYNKRRIRALYGKPVQDYAACLLNAVKLT